jgi:hypothetical protein
MLAFSVMLAAGAGMAPDLVQQIGQSAPDLNQNER